MKEPKLCIKCKVRLALKGRYCGGCRAKMKTKALFPYQRRETKE